ncbi:MAG: polysaccharide deacetylase family protein [Eubacteriales bacterium]
MKNEFSFLYILKKAAALLLLPAVLISCTGKPSQPSKNVGVSRPAELVASETLPSPDSSETEKSDPEKPPLDAPEEQDDSPSSSDSAQTGGISWTFQDGRYSYTFPEPDRSGLSDLSAINSTSRALFSDQGEDESGSWYFGKTHYDSNNGEVTYVWDRSDATKQLLHDNLGIYRGDETRKVCYFTFDCGYENGYTNAILDVLAEKNVAGVFFLTGQYVKTAQEQIRRMIDEGHILGNHTVDHPNMTQVTAEEFINQIEGLEDMVKAAFPDSQPILYYRPPYGAANEWTLKLASRMGIRTVLWSFTYKDYDPDDQLDYASALEKVKGGLHPGAVYLFHTVSKTNSEILGEAIDWIRSQGYEILPICDIDVNPGNA